MPETMEKKMQTPEHTDDLDLVAHRFEWARIRLNLRVVEVVCEAGFDNVEKGCQKLRDIEDGQPQPPSIYARFARVLNIDLDKLEEDLKQQRHERHRRFRQEIPPPQLGDLLQSARHKAEMSVEEVASRTQGAVSPKRLHRLEGGRDRFPTDDEIEALAAALSIKEEAIRAVYERERRVYDEQDKAPKLVMRALPGFYVNVSLPQPASTKQQLDYAMEYSRELNKKVCLVFTDGRSIYINPDGERSETFDPPSMSIG